MRRLVTLIVVCLVVLGLPLLAGGGTGTVADTLGLFDTPAYAFDGDEMDVWPCFFGTDNGGPDNGYMVFYDQDVNAFQAPRLIDNDLLDGQWTPQRNAIGWKTDGSYNVSFIEDTTDDLEIWESPDDGWQDDAGAWTMTDNNVGTYLSVDVESKQNFIWALPGTVAAIAVASFYIDLTLGIPNWTQLPLGSISPDNTSYSLILDRDLYGSTRISYLASGAVNYAFFEWSGAPNITAPGTITGSPQVIIDKEERVWVFGTDSNNLYTSPSLDDPLDMVWGDVYQVYPANSLTSDYHATWLKADDTIHVVLVDFSLVANSTTLRYLRRTPNRWSAPITLLTVDSDLAGDNDSIEWPQITVDPLGGLFAYFVFDSDFGDVGVGGDLQGFHLDFTDNDDYGTPATWTRYTNIDASADNILWCVAPDSVPIASDI